MCVARTQWPDVTVRFHSLTAASGINMKALQKANVSFYKTPSQDRKSKHLALLYLSVCRCQWPSGLRRRSAAARLLRLCVRIPPKGMDICLLWVLCVVRWRSLRRADHSSRGVLPTVMRHCVWCRNLKNEEVMARVGPQRHKKKSVCPQATVRPPRGSDFHEILFFNYFSKICPESSRFIVSWQKGASTLHEDLRTIVIKYRWIMPRRRNVSDRSCRESQNTHITIFPYCHQILTPYAQLKNSNCISTYSNNGWNSGESK